MNKILKSTLAVALGLMLTGCYNDFDRPAPAKVYSDADFASSQIISIKQLKDKFYQMYPDRAGIGKAMPVEQDYVIRGKVISSDRTGNLYKSLYIYDADGESAIELRLSTGNYLFHPVGQIVYVKLQGLVIGNYRGMLSVGAPSDGIYANNPIESPVMLKEHILSGVQEQMLPSDTLVVTKANYATTLSDKALGRLVRFEGLESRFGVAQWGYRNAYPNYFASAVQSKPFDVTSPGWEDIPQWATWALAQRIGTEFRPKGFYYGSAWFTYNPGTTIPGNYVVRTSAYSNFWEQKIPASGKIVDLTAIYTLYTGSNTSNDTYQLSLITAADVIVK